VTLAYTFWHRPMADVESAAYERDLDSFHAHLAAPAIPGLAGSRTLRVPDLPWQPGGGYEDWYLVDGFGALADLATGAVDAAHRSSHAALARAAGNGAGGLYGLVAGAAFAPAAWAGWYVKNPGVGYPALLAALVTLAGDERIAAAWQRQLVLGPAPEFRVEAAGPVAVTGATLAAAAPIDVSGWRST
jgi:hypothetical protein